MTIGTVITTQKTGNLGHCEKISQFSAALFHLRLYNLKSGLHSILAPS